ncbi:hypothetical protein [Acidovorax sp. BLS4]|uniref:hypothetical protein n=1 Tax=Acidovorax sp. BLS4 TaxID=3273430 RepID=UPI00294276B7|nr:hypothetical protein [Paracidovorax avenae]WOI45843.1 hypothetical protein R1Z03_01110 [Paracidovorax avenae]
MAVKVSHLKPTFTAPAAVYLPGDGGAHERVDFEVHFKRQPGRERDALNDRYLKGEIKNAELLDEIVVGWRGFNDEAGQPVPYSHEERREAEAEYSGVESAMVVSWYDHAFIHQREAAVKNSKAPSLTTSAPTTQTATS